MAALLPLYTRDTPSRLLASNATLFDIYGPGSPWLTCPNAFGYHYCAACDTGRPPKLTYWQVTGWSACTAPCGGGTRLRQLACYTGQKQTDYALCNASCSEYIPQFEACNMQPCLRIDQTAFSCDPAGGSVRCSDLVRDGGRATLHVLGVTKADFAQSADIRAQYGLTRDNTYWDPPAIAGLPDPYVIVKIGSVVGVTKPVINSANPVWGDGKNFGAQVELGLRMSGTPILLELWDKNGGITHEDRLVAAINTTVLGCSWASPPDFGPCTERTYLPLLPGTSCFLKNTEDGKYNESKLNNAVPCLRIMQQVVPHNVSQVSIPLGWNATYSMANTWRFAGGVGDLNSGTGAADVVRLDAAWPPFAPALGGMVIKFAKAAPLYSPGSVTAVFKNAFRSRVWLFRYVDSAAQFADTEPKWLNSSWRLLPADGEGGLSARMLDPGVTDTVPWNTTGLATARAQFRAYEWFGGPPSAAGQYMEDIPHRFDEPYTMPSLTTFQVGGCVDGWIPLGLPGGSVYNVSLHMYFIVMQLVPGELDDVLRPAATIPARSLWPLFMALGVALLLALLIVLARRRKRLAKVHAAVAEAAEGAEASRFFP